MTISWDRYFLNIADAVAKKSKCLKRQVGCVIIDRYNRICSTGFNGRPRNCEEVKICKRQDVESGTNFHIHCGEVHSEQNALIFSNFSEIQGGSIYITCAPCEQCALLIMQSGINNVVFYNDKRKDGVKLIRSLKPSIKIREYSRD